MSSRRWCFNSGLILASCCLVALLGSADGRVLLLARNSVVVSLLASLISLPVGTGLGFVLLRTDLPLRRALQVLVVTMLFLPLYLQAAAWSAGFGKLGWYNLGPGSLSAPLLHGWGAVVWIHAMAAVPWVTLLVGASLQMSEPELEELALLDLAPGRVFWHVTLRRALPGVAVAWVWVTLACVTEMTVTDLYQIRTLAEELYTGFALSVGDEPSFGAWTGVLATLLLVGLAMMALDLLVAEHVPVRAAFRFPLGRWRWPLSVAVCLVLLLLVGVPVGSLLFQAGLQVEQQAGVPVHHWTWTQLTELLVPLPATYRYSVLWEFADVFGWTLLVGGSAASLSLVVAVPLAWYARRGQWRVVPAALVAAVGLATMGPLIGLAVSELFSLSDNAGAVWLRDRTIAAPVLVQAVRALPVPILICLAAFRSLPRETIDAATLDGARPLRKLWWLGVRQRPAAVGIAWLFALAIAFSELSATIMVSPPGITTLPICVFRLLHAGVRNQVAALCLTSLLGVAVVALFVTGLGARWIANDSRGSPAPAQTD